jgi:hypothetical protein
MSWSKGSEWGSGLGQNAARSGTRADSRFHGRFKIQCRVTLSWEDAEGHTCSMRVRGLDMSRLGARVESSEPMAPGTFVFLQAPELKLMGGAVVKHCSRRGFNYRIGVEFRNPLTKCF